MNFSYLVLLVAGYYLGGLYGMGEVTFKGVFFEENCTKASHGGNCPGVFLVGNFLRKQLYKGKAIFLGSNCPGVG